jgi:hypothetical protein
MTIKGHIIMKGEAPYGGHQRIDLDCDKVVTFKDNKIQFIFGMQGGMALPLFLSPAEQRNLDKWYNKSSLKIEVAETAEEQELDADFDDDATDV